MEVPSFCLSTRSTIISLKLVTDAACPGIIIHSLPSTGRARDAGHIPTHATQAEQPEGRRATGCVCATSRDLEDRHRGSRWAGLADQEAGRQATPWRCSRLAPVGVVTALPPRPAPVPGPGEHPHTDIKHTRTHAVRKDTSGHIQETTHMDPQSQTHVSMHTYTQATRDTHAHAQTCQAHLP